MIHLCFEHSAINYHLKTQHFVNNSRNQSDAKPEIGGLLDPKSVGTHVVTSMTYGGEVYASVNFVALKAEYLEDIRRHFHL
ncbi:hypothetical protein NPIL_543181 [Nephila pilipes]|uniref:Uncharacterized protein n=1 Tax=Nephila pilipes TaxID=299642 RepID=A0A8X6Q111_NEPPI|nr:hypothetical protein NPIL_543181 [Nephila pilipes]